MRWRALLRLEASSRDAAPDIAGRQLVRWSGALQLPSGLNPDCPLIFSSQFCCQPGEFEAEHLAGPVLDGPLSSGAM